MMDMRILVFGAGFSGRHIGKACAASGATVAGTTRSKENFSYLESADVQPLLFDGETVTSHLRHVLAETTHLVISIAPPRHEYLTVPDQPIDPVLIALGNSSLAEIAPGLRWIGYLSTVGVYGDHDGAWVNEETPVSPTSERSRQRVRAEDEWQAVSDTAGIPLAIFRLSGIYGPGRNALATAGKGKPRCR